MILWKTSSWPHSNCSEFLLILIGWTATFLFRFLTCFFSSYWSLWFFELKNSFSYFEIAKSQNFHWNLMEKSNNFAILKSFFKTSNSFQIHFTHPHLNLFINLIKFHPWSECDNKHHSLNQNPLLYVMKLLEEFFSYS